MVQKSLGTTAGAVKWTTPSNWGYGSEVAAYAAPLGNVRVVFPESFAEGTTVELEAKTTEGVSSLDLELGCDILFTTSEGVKNRAELCDVNSITGTGTLRLGRIWLEGKGSAKVVIDTDIEVVGDAILRPVGARSGAMTLNGALTGNGTLTLRFGDYHQVISGESTESNAASLRGRVFDILAIWLF